MRTACRLQGVFRAATMCSTLAAAPQAACPPPRNESDAPHQ